MAEGTSELVKIRLLGIPLALQERASEHNEDLKREFRMLVEQGHADPSSVPGRLVTLAAELDRRFHAFTAQSRSEIEDARRRGETSVDVSFRAPAAVAPASEEFKALLEEADKYCAAGKHLLTLAPAPEIVRFRNWVLGEITRQVEGLRPTPWHEYAAQAQEPR